MSHALERSLNWFSCNRGFRLIEKFKRLTGKSAQFCGGHGRFQKNVATGSLGSVGIMRRCQRGRLKRGNIQEMLRGVNRGLNWLVADTGQQLHCWLCEGFRLRKVQRPFALFRFGAASESAALLRNRLRAFRLLSRSFFGQHWILHWRTVVA